MKISKFREELSACDWLFDLFATGYDYLLNRVVSADDQLNLTLFEHAEELGRRRIRPRLVTYDGGIPPELWMFLGNSSQVPDWKNVPDTQLEDEAFLRRLLAVLRLIDEVAGDFSYFSHGLSAREWQGVQSFLKLHHHELNRDTDRTVILKPLALEAMEWWQVATRPSGPKVSDWKQPEMRGQFLERLFKNLSRVPNYGELNNCNVTHIVVPARDDAEKGLRGPLKIAVVPTIHDAKGDTSGLKLLPGPLCIVPVDGSKFVVRVEDKPDFGPLVKSVENSLRTLCQRGTHVIVFPELVIPDPVLAKIQETLLSLTKAGSPGPFLVVAGSFGRPGPQRGDDYNTAVVLNGRGTVLFRQRKMHAYTMYPYEQPRYSLDKLFGGKPRTEQMQLAPRELVVCDSPQTGFRFSILICEDFCQAKPGPNLIAEMGGNLVLSPVMAGSLTEKSGFFSSAKSLVDTAGAAVVVGNSCALPSQENGFKKSGCGLAIMGSPLKDLSAAGDLQVRVVKHVPGQDFVEFSIPNKLLSILVSCCCRYAVLIV
ncbi:MAG: hypothetical protein LAO24_18245 [Acidobacteriia bacterium]|nr:hypothetical protein [Terriglobia bacterium]